MTYNEAIRVFNYSPSMQRIIVRRHIVPNDIAREYMAKIYRSLKKHNLLFQSDLNIYTYVDIDPMKSVFLDALTKDKKQLSIDNLDVFLTNKEMKDLNIPTSFNKIKRSITREEWDTRNVRLCKD